MLHNVLQDTEGKLHHLLFGSRHHRDVRRHNRFPLAQCAVGIETIEAHRGFRVKLSERDPRRKLSVVRDNSTSDVSVDVSHLDGDGFSVWDAFYRNNFVGVAMGERSPPGMPDDLVEFGQLVRVDHVWNKLCGKLLHLNLIADGEVP